MSGSNTITLTGKIEESIYPKQQSEILRDVILTKKFTLKRGLYGKDVSIDGEGTIVGPVYASSEVSVQCPKDGKSTIKFLSGIDAVLSILITSKGRFLGKPSALDSAKFYIKGDVVSEIVKIDNAIVFGNVRGKKITINNSTIVGGIYAEEQVVIENSRFVSFSTNEAILKGEVYCWLPYGISRLPIRMEESLLPDGKKIQSKLIFTGFGDRQFVELNQNDIHVHYMEDGSEVYALNLGRRALNLEPIETEYKKIENFIYSVLIFEQLDNHSKEVVLSNSEKEMLPEESSLFKKFCEI